ncbi:nuclear transport factor 2 family protein [Nocardioides sp. WS12]|uniref:nuclear transport factor 2 family protein n=1 Tax=Nocardioides sp. WS12 TaxID=2486272 RepID=UPI0015FE36B7|nr:nuclear transport factor 2 family protein [Nocardioides sp. WS12]
MSSQPHEIVAAFYEAAAGRDAGALDALLESSFHEDAAVHWPEGLPYGGRIEGRAILRKVFAGLATPDPVMGPENLTVVSVVDGGGDQVVAQVAFDWRANGATIASGALELWTFAGGLVTEVRAYYWDTAACQDLLR